MSKTDSSKKDAKDFLAGLAILLIFFFYFYLFWKSNLKQKIRMVASWVLFFIIIKINPENLSITQFNSFRQYSERKELYEGIMPYAVLIWLGFVVATWVIRYHESEASKS